ATDLGATPPPPDSGSLFAPVTGSTDLVHGAGGTAAHAVSGVATDPGATPPPPGSDSGSPSAPLSGSTDLVNGATGPVTNATDAAAATATHAVSGVATDLGATPPPPGSDSGSPFAPLTGSTDLVNGATGPVTNATDAAAATATHAVSGVATD